MTADRTEWSCPETGRTCTAEDCGRECFQGAAEGDALPPLPKVGPIGFASVVDVESYALWLKIGPHLPGVRDVALWTTDQMRAYARAALPAVQPKAAEAPEIGEVTWQQAADAIENLDDYARMMVGVDPSGPRETLYRFLEQAKAALANVQPKGTAVAWSRQQLIHDDDGYSIGADEPELHWGKEPPDDEAGWHPLYAAAGVTTRDAALEEAAQVCERWNTTPGRKLAGEIRALAAQAPAPAPGLNSDDFLQLSAEVWPADAPRTGERAWWPAQLKTQLCPRMADLTHFGALVEREVLRRVSESQAPAVKDAARVAAKWYLQAHNRMNLAGEAIAISIGHEIDREGFLAGIHDNELARSVTDWMRKIDRRNGELATAGPTDRALMRKALEALEAYSRWAASMDVEMQAHNAITDLRTALDGESDVPVQPMGDSNG